MNQYKNNFNLPLGINSSNLTNSYLNFKQNSVLINNNSFNSSIPSSNIIYHYSIKKRNHNQLMEFYKEKNNNLYKKENEEIFKKINMNFQSKINKFKSNYQNKLSNEKLILNEKKNKIEKKKEIKLETKKFMIDDDIDIVEKDFMFEKERKVEKKFGLSKSYLYEEEPGFYSDFDDTKETSFSSLNFSYDYPELNFDTAIKDKLITNAIELEKTFNRFFNVKNMPNKL